MILIYLICPMALVALLIPPLSKLCDKFNLKDQPGWGKVHVRSTPTIGGLLFISISIVSILLFSDFFTGNTGFLIGLLMIMGLGLIDDIGSIPHSKWIKPLWVLAAVGLVIWLDGLNIPYLFSPITGNIAYLGYGSVVLVLFFVFAYTNGTNFIDGIDGLAAGVVSISLGYIALLSFLTDQTGLILVSLVFLGSTIGFLVHNFPRASIFMGDVGSLTLGFTLAVLAIKMTFPQVNPDLISPMTPVYVLGLPIMDTTQVVFIRLWRRENIFQPDTKHLHHRILKHGLSEKQTLALLYTFSALLGGLGILMADQPIVIQFWLFVGIFLFVVVPLVGWLASHKVYYTQSGGTKLPLKKILLKEDMISEPKLREAMESWGEEKEVKLGRFLVEEGYIEKSQLQKALLIQGEEQVDYR